MRGSGFCLFLSLSCLLLIQLEQVAAASKSFDLIIERKFISPDGFTRPGITVNGQMPGPVLKVTEGDQVTVNVINMMKTHETSLHFHGISQIGTPFFDGPIGTTQVGAEVLIEI